MTTRVETIFLERRKTKLSFAVSLVDEYTKEKPIGGIEVSLKETGARAVKNPGSYYLFLNLPDGSYTVQVKSDYYFDEVVGGINPAELDPRSPVVPITLKPTPSYPFPSAATLIRGMVYDSAGKAASDAKITVVGKDVEGKTTERGEFMLYFGSLTEDDIIVEDGKRYVKGNADKIIHLEVEYEGITKLMDLEVEEGKTTTKTIELPPS